jgi:hypothetical protein
MIKIHASYDTRTGEIMLANYTATDHETASLFPKSTKLRAGGWWTGVRFAADARTGGKNETAVRQLRSLIKNAAKHGVEIDTASMITNSYKTLAELEAALAAYMAA